MIPKPNRQIERTKSWIFDALMLLMDEKPYNKITVSDIAEKAGIARPTFYRNFNDKDDVAFEYLSKTIDTELLNVDKTNKDDKHHTIVLRFDYNYMIKHQKNLRKILAVADIENRVSREVQKFLMSLAKHYKEKLTPEEYLICRYKLCYQITGCIRVFFDWFIGNMPTPVDRIVAMLNAMNMPRTSQYRNIPRIAVRLKNE